MTTSRTWSGAVVVALMTCGVLATPTASFAQVEVTGVIGGMLGGDLDNFLFGTSSIKSTYKNGPLYGARVAGSASSAAPKAASSAAPAE